MPLTTLRSSDSQYLLPRTGRISLTPDGDLEVRHDNGQLAGVFWCCAGGLAYEGEVTLTQYDDPPALRFVNVGRSQPRAALGKLSWNVIRAGTDDVQEEVAFFKGAISEDVEDFADYRGQMEYRVRTDTAGEPILAMIISDAYTLAEYGVRKLRVYVRTLYTTLGDFGNLWKWQ